MHQTTRSYVIPIGFGTILCLAAFISVLWFVDPFTAGVLPHIFFYVTLFLTISGLASLVGITVRKRYTPGMFTEQLRASFRQGLLIALLVITLLLLQSFSLLFWWVGLTLILFIITLEIFLNS